MMAANIREWSVQDSIQFGGPTAKLVVDTLLNRELRVTKQMIRDGNKRDCKRCPVALAILAVLPKADVYADCDFLMVDGVRFVLPDNAERFMSRFDYTSNRESMSGIRFTLTQTAMFYTGRECPIP